MGLHLLKEVVMFQEILGGKLSWCKTPRTYFQGIYVFIANVLEMLFSAQGGLFRMLSWVCHQWLLVSFMLCDALFPSICWLQSCFVKVSLIHTYTLQ